MTENATIQTEATPETNNVRERREALGLGRSGLAELSGLTAAKIWRVEQNRPTGDELPVLNAVLDGLETNGLPENMKPRRKTGEPKVKRITRAELELMIANVQLALVESEALKTAKDLRAALDRVRDIVNPQPEAAVADDATPEPTTDGGDN